MSMIVATCRCGRRYYRFARTEWDKASTLHWCPGCRMDDGFSHSPLVGVWSEL